MVAEVEFTSTDPPYSALSVATQQICLKLAPNPYC